MGRFSGISLAFPLLLLASACGLHGPAVDEATSDSSRPQFVLATPWPTDEAPAYTTPRPDVRSLAAAFSRAICEYDARTESRSRFLTDAAPLASAGLQQSADELRARGQSLAQRERPSRCGALSH